MGRLTYCLFYLERRGTQHFILKNATSCYSCCCHSPDVMADSSWSSYFYNLFVSAKKFFTNREVSDDVGKGFQQ